MEQAKHDKTALENLNYLIGLSIIAIVAGDKGTTKDYPRKM